tara:strand:+ start:149 stop:451 length:303 start_codon:yes stop_codon:yes gene_type:complete
MNKQYYVKDNKFIIKYNDKEYSIPKPFDQCFFGSNPTKEMTIGNRFNDEHYQQYAKLPAFAVAIYDTIIGAERTEDYDTMQKGLDWFSRNFTDAYFKLLD